MGAVRFFEVMSENFKVVTNYRSAAVSNAQKYTIKFYIYYFIILAMIYK
jgi:hypothetical protein